MSYSYDSLESILEEASYRLPVSLVGKLITQVENVITNLEDGYDLERKISDLIAEHTGTKVRVFNLRGIEEADKAEKQAREELLAA
jgi:hypothetical protein